MDDSIHQTRRTRWQRARLLAAAAVMSGVLVAGCGGGSNSPTVANVAGTTTSTPSAASAGATITPASGATTTTRSSTATGSGAASPGSTAPSDPEAEALAYSKCMRANGVPNFPDPNSGGGFVFQQGSGVNPSSPLFKAAQAKCGKLLPGGGPPGSGPPPSAQALAHWVKVAQCMRRHGISDFPDPRTSAPPLSSLHGGGVISDRDGVILVFPASIDMQSPLFTRAAAACGFQLTNH